MRRLCLQFRSYDCNRHNRTLFGLLMKKIRRHIAVALSILGLIMPLTARAETTGNEIIDEYISTCLSEEQQKIFTKEFTDTLLTKCAEYDINPWFAMAIMEYESSFNPDAVASDNAHLGLMQLSTYYFTDDITSLCPRDKNSSWEAGFFDAVANETVGIRYLAKLRDNSEKYRSVKNSNLDYPTEYFIAMSYNEGEGNILENYRSEEVGSYATNVVNTMVANEKNFGSFDLDKYRQEHAYSILNDIYYTR